MSDAQPAEMPTPAGLYDYGLGGANYTEADRAASEFAKQVMPELLDAAWANRGFLQRAVKRMAQEWGIGQFLDIGSGFPTQRNTHDVVAEVIPDGRVVYVDNDPRVIERGREILGEAPATAMVLADLSRPDDVLDHPETKRLIDFTEPLGLLLVGVTPHVVDEDDPWSAVARYLNVMASGSYIALSATTSDYYADHIVEAVSDVGPIGNQLRIENRSRAEIERFFDGLQIVPPYQGAGATLTYIGLWGAEDPESADDDSSRFLYAAVARKP